MDVLVTIEDPAAVHADEVDLVEIPLCDQKAIGVKVTVDTDDMFVAIGEAARQVTDLGGKVVRVVARDPDTPINYPVVGVKEFAEARGIERHHASTVTRRKGFPDEIATLGGGPVWEMVDVALHIRDHARR